MQANAWEVRAGIQSEVMEQVNIRIGADDLAPALAAV